MADFEKATRQKYTFETSKGSINLQDLWDLPLTSSVGRPNLDDIARNLHQQLKNDTNVSFVHTDRKSDEVIQAKFDIVKHIIDVKIAENKLASEAHARKQQKEKILAIMADKEDESLKNMDVTELRKLLESLPA